MLTTSAVAAIVVVGFLFFDEKSSALADTFLDFSGLGMVMEAEAPTPEPADFTPYDYEGLEPNFGGQSVKEFVGSSIDRLEVRDPATLLLKTVGKVIEKIEKEGEDAPYVTVLGRPCNPNEQRLCFHRYTTTTTTTYPPFFANRRREKREAQRIEQMLRMKEKELEHQKSLVPPLYPLKEGERRPGSWMGDVWYSATSTTLMEPPTSTTALPVEPSQVQPDFLQSQIRSRFFTKRKYFV